MTLYEAVGIKNGDTDIKTGNKLSFQEIFTRMVNFLGGPEVFTQYLPLEGDELVKAYKNDPTLNNMPIQIWNSRSGFTQYTERKTLKRVTEIHPGWGVLRLTESHGINEIGMSTTVCLLKQAARMLAENIIAQGAAIYA